MRKQIVTSIWAWIAASAYKMVLAEDLPRNLRRELSEVDGAGATGTSAANATPVKPGDLASSLVTHLTDEEREEMNKSRGQWGIDGSDFVNINQNFGDLWEPFDYSKDTPFFLMVPKSGTSTFQDFIRRCNPEITLASHLGGPHENDSLEEVEIEGHRYFNVNPSTREGIFHAGKVGIARSGKAGVLVAPFLHQVATIFDEHNQARWFTMIRNPIDRTTSLFYYVQVNEHEAAYLPDNYKPWLKDWSVIQYVNSDMYTDNWLVRQIVGKSNKSLKINREDLKNAKYILARKCLIGLLIHYEESLQRFSAYFGWKGNNQCLHEFMNGDSGARNVNKHPRAEHMSEEWKAIVEKNLYDMELYTYALELFEKQKELFVGERALPMPSQ